MPENSPDPARDDDKPLILRSAFPVPKTASPDLLIRAYIHEVDAFKRCSFTRERIERIAENVKEGGSTILLKDGGCIYVRMPMDELEEKIYLCSQKEMVLDLRVVSGPANKDEPDSQGRPAQEFKKVAPKTDRPVAEPKDVPLKLAFFAGGSQSSETLNLYVLEEKDIDWRDVKDAGYGKTLVLLSEAKLNKSAANTRWIYLDMPVKELMAYYTQAKAAGYSVLDLRERTMVKNDANGKAIKLMPESPQGLK